MYEPNYPVALRRYGGLIYIIATIIPPFFSSIKKVWIIGTAILISYILANIFYEGYVVSVWCFFAAIISILVLVVISYIRNQAGAHIVKMAIDLPISK